VPRGRLNEKHVQRVAVNWLTSYYEGKSGVQDVRAETEVAVRADCKLNRLPVRLGRLLPLDSRIGSER
jgi:hypothetical protein